jgi:hypothetical protein
MTVSPSPTINDVQEYAKSKNGMCLSSDYVNARKPLIWQCSKQHAWIARWDSIKNQPSWCPICAKNVKQDITTLQDYAKNKSGKLLTEIYINCKTNLTWQCNKDHIWQATWDNISRGKWCPYCSHGKTEEVCRELLETKLHILLPSKRIIYKGNRYCFDRYNKEHRIAFEYHGYQHYIFPNYFHKTEERFIAAQQRDKDKEQYCKENNITLIVIPHTITDLDNYITTLDALV